MERILKSRQYLSTIDLIKADNSIALYTLQSLKLDQIYIKGLFYQFMPYCSLHFHGESFLWRILIDYSPSVIFQSFSAIYQYSILQYCILMNIENHILCN